jgi:hypothetical protein
MTDDSDTTMLPALAGSERRRRPAPSCRQQRPGHALYRVALSGDDLSLLQACSRWICRLGPAPDIRARLVHLEQRLAGARPAR